MIKEVIDHINCKIKELNITSNLFGLCEIVKSDNKEFPAYYENGEYKRVITDGGCIFHLMDSPFSQSENEDQSVDGCDLYIERDYKIKLIAIVKKELKGNNNYSDEKIASLISNKIQSKNNKDLRELINVDNIYINAKTIDLNRNNIFSRIFKNVDTFIDFEYTLISIEYSIVISANESCFVNC